MEDSLTIINWTIKEHHTIGEHLKLVGDSMNDLEGVFGLQKASPDWVHSSAADLSGKQAKLQQTISALDEGLRKHFGFEESLLPPLFGGLLMQALILEHREIKRQLDGAKSLLGTAKMEGMGQKELLDLKAHIQQKVEDILQLLEEHASREEIILKMLKKALEAEKQSGHASPAA